MANDNFVQIVGTVTADPELRFTTGGLAVASWTVAWNPRKKDENGNWTNGDPTFFRCTAWRDMAENVAGSLQKGARVVVTGQVTARDWEDKEGNKRTSVEIQVDEVAPSLRWATTVVEKTTREKGDGAGNHEAPARQSGGKRQPASDSSYGGSDYPYPDAEEPF